MGDSKNLKTVSNWNHPEDWKVIIPPGTILVHGIFFHSDLYNIKPATAFQLDPDPGPEHFFSI